MRRPEDRQVFGHRELRQPAELHLARRDRAIAKGRNGFGKVANVQSRGTTFSRAWRRFPDPPEMAEARTLLSRQWGDRISPPAKV